MPALTAATNFLHRRRVELFIPHKFPAGNSERQASSGDCGGTCFLIGLQDIAIDPDGPRPEFFKIDDCSQRPVDQPLDLDAATVEATFATSRGFRVCVEYGSIEYSAARSHSLLFHPARHCFFDCDAANDACLPIETSTERLA
jgi:hypothetical protein